MKKKLFGFFYELRYTALFFVFFVFNSVVAVGHFSLPKLAHPPNYTIHLFDFSFGFCTRFLTGQLYRWFTGGDYNPYKIEAYNRVLLVIAFLMISALLSRAVKSVPEKDRRLYVLVGLFYVSGPLTFSLFSIGLGIVDTLWLIFIPLFLFLLGNKYLKFAAPLLVLPIILTHFSALICYMVLVFFVLIYLASSQKEKREKTVYWGIFAVTFVAAAVLAVYFATHEYSNAVYTVDEMHRQIMQRSQIGEFTDTHYIDFDVYKIATIAKDSYPYEKLTDDVLIPEGSRVPAVIARFINAAWPNMNCHLHYYFDQKGIPVELTGDILQTVFFLPVWVFIIRYWLHRIKIAREEGNLVQRLLFALAIAYIPVILIFWFLFSMDYFRYYNHTVIIEGAFLIYVMFKNPTDTAEWLKARFGAYNRALLYIYAAIYLLTGSVVA